MGYVGPALVSRLRTVYPGSVLVGIDIGYFGHCLTGAEMLPERQLNLQYFMDVRNLPIELLEDTDAIVHLAAISNDPMGKAYQEITADVNYKASVRLAKQAKKAGVKAFVFASSCSVYGFAEGAPRTEISALNPLTAYAKSKIDTEKAIRELASRDFTITCLRFPTACGMSDRVRLDLVLNDFVAAAVASKRIDILSDGTPWRPLIDVKDMARAMDWAINRQAATGGEFLTVNVGRNEWNYQVKDLAESVREVMPEIEIDINQNAQPDKRSYCVDFSLYSQLAPNHQPQVSLRQSILELKSGLEKIGFQDKNFRNSRYIRLKVLSALQQKGWIGDQLEWIEGNVQPKMVAAGAI